MSSIVEMTGIRKSFGGSHALKGVDFALEKGTIHALLGENGAGKSTLMNILGGVIQPDSGLIKLGGVETKSHSPAEAKANGIAFIHQELTLVNDLSIYENVFLGTELMRFGFVDSAEMRLRTRKVLSRMDVDLDPGTLVRDLDASYKQVVEIARAIQRNAGILIMDEPTSSLTAVEINNVFSIMKTLKGDGVSIIFISHKLQEVIQICDAFTVLRDGAVVANGPIRNPDAPSEPALVGVVELAHHMVGKNVMGISHYRPREQRKTVLEVENLSHGTDFDEISFSLKQGEILGFTGLLGDGRSELFECIFGCRKGYQGSIRVDGKTVQMVSPEKSRSLGIGYVPKNRKENAIVKDLSILHNLTLSALEKFNNLGFIRARAERKAADRRIIDLNIKMGSVEDPIGSLSGGNQQKIILARWLESDPDILIFDNPTQGVDVGAKNDIYDIIMAMAANGLGVVILSSEPGEIIQLCDSAHVLYHGRIQGTLERSELSEENIMVLATGGSMDSSPKYA